MKSFFTVILLAAQCCFFNIESQADLTQVFSGLSSPVQITNAKDKTNRLFIVEKGGKIQVASNGTVASTPFLDISNQVSTDGERGLLSVAFHPKHRSNGLFFVNYTDKNGDTIIARYRVMRRNASQADLRTKKTILKIQQPYSNHNGGGLAFGRDGFLYIGMGDGGSGGDPENRAQNLSSLLGKFLRIDIDQGSRYAIPATNPFRSRRGVKPEIFAYGFRNPWRFSFDRGGSHRLFAGDVGQGQREEIDIVQRGKDYGWRKLEGTSCYNPSSGCTTNGTQVPINEYDHSLGIAVTGGFVYRGKTIPSLVGLYVFGDFGSGTIWTLQEVQRNVWTRSVLLETNHSISSFGEDEAGELYVVDIGGSILKFVP